VKAASSKSKSIVHTLHVILSYSFMKLKFPFIHLVHIIELHVEFFVDRMA